MPTRELRYSLTFNGMAAPDDEMGVRMTIDAEAPVGAWLDPVFTDGGFQPALFSSMVENEAEGVFTESGTITFGAGALEFSTVGEGMIEPSADPTRQHGIAIWQVEGGTGAFENASGYIMSNFTVDENGNVRDSQAAVIFLPD